MAQRYLNRTQAADKLDKNRRTLEQWERKGFGPPVIRPPGANPMYAEADIDAWIDKYRVVPSHAVSQ